MRIGVLEILTDDVSPSWIGNAYNLHIRRAYASVTPQAISVWCRELGHEVHYATYFGQGRAEDVLPHDLDVVFMATYTRASMLAYALARIYRARGATTILGGAHATAFPTDSLRFFDFVVHDCAMLPGERLSEDFRFVSEKLPGVLLAIHDPNFAVRFDDVLQLMERIPPGRRNPYAMESSLAILRGSRLRRLQETNCVYAAPGVESWVEYSNKSAVGARVGREKLEKVVEHFEELHEYVPGLQANFIFGTDGDIGSEPVELTCEFIRRLPFVWPTINIPVPFGGTPLYDQFIAEQRVLEAMPFAFYYAPYVVVRPLHYSTLELYDNLIRMHGTIASMRLLARRLRASSNSARFAAMYLFRGLSEVGVVRELRKLRNRIAADRELLAFHEGTRTALPAYYRGLMKERLGRFAEVLSEEDLTPRLEPVAEAPGRQVAVVGS